jgi:4-methyl-5(b-hydroxyethyl)-thiazole monophosphate biosynthesis
MPKIMIALAPGSEEIEAVTLVDTLRRADLEVDLVSITQHRQITASRGVVLVADSTINSVNLSDYHMLILPGGVGGSEALRDCPKLIDALKQAQAEHRWIAAICAAPALVLAHHQLLGKARVTCHPSFIEQIPESNRAAHRVVIDERHKLVTSQGPGTSLEFALTLIELICGKEKAQQVAAPMLL